MPLPLPPPSVFFAVASALIKVLDNTPDAVSTAEQPQIPDVIQKLFNVFSLKIPTSLDQGDAQLDSLVQVVLDKIKSIKPGLAVTGGALLDAATVKAITAIVVRCTDSGREGVKPTDNENTNVASKHNIFTTSPADVGEVIAYKIDSTIPATVQGKSTISLIDAAADNWNVNVARLLILRSEDANGYCNVTITNVSLGAGVLGESPVAGPGNLGGNMLLKVNLSEIGEDFRTFIETITHEFGHIAGLRHNETNPSAIMYPSVPPGTVDPTQEDIDAMQAKWGAPPV